MRPTITKIAVPALAMGVLLALPGCHYHQHYGHHGHHAGHGHHSSQDSVTTKRADVRKREPRGKDRSEGRY